MNIYIVGIGGAGTSALAEIYHERGHNISGSDDGDGFYVEQLKNMSILVHVDFDSAHIIKDIDLVVHSTAISEKNVELVAARKKKIPVITYPEAIGRLTRKMKTIAVCGTHGKTTTTALLAHALIETHFKITAIVGSRVSGWNGGAYAAGDDFFVIEADEYQNKLALYEPCCVLLTSIDFDHPDYFADLDAYKKTFADFIEKVPVYGCITACGDDPDVRDIVSSSPRQVTYYGVNDDNDYQIIDRTVQDSGQIITVRHGKRTFEIFTQLFGEHNAKNALGAWIIATTRSGEPQRATIGIGKCKGTARRFEQRGKLNSAVLIDDYAHHPEEIRATLTSAREIYPQKKIIVAFHPHTFTRTKALLPAFADALDLADKVIVLDIYGSAREKKGDVSARDLVDVINDASKEKAQHIPTIDKLAPWMKNELKKNDVFLTLGAGDVWQVYDLLKIDK